MHGCTDACVRLAAALFKKPNILLWLLCFSVSDIEADGIDGPAIPSSAYTYEQGTICAD